MSLDIKCLGRLARDPVQKDIGEEKKITTFSFVTDAGITDSKGKRQSLFFNVNAFGKNADTIMQYCKKGTQLNITGNVYDNSAFISKDGDPHPSLNITLEKFEFVSSKKE